MGFLQFVLPGLLYGKVAIDQQDDYLKLESRRCQALLVQGCIFCTVTVEVEPIDFK